MRSADLEVGERVNLSFLLGVLTRHLQPAGQRRFLRLSLHCENISSLWISVLITPLLMQKQAFACAIHSPCTFQVVILEARIAARKCWKPKDPTLGSRADSNALTPAELSLRTLSGRQRVSTADFRRARAWSHWVEIWDR